MASEYCAGSSVVLLLTFWGSFKMLATHHEFVAMHHFGDQKEMFDVSGNLDLALLQSDLRATTEKFAQVTS